jgi:hypothetical protein
VILFNIIAPAGWRIGLLRIEDIALGCAVSLVVGLLFWPRGAGAALRAALATAYVDTARYLGQAVEFGMLCCDFGRPAPAAPTDDALRAVASSRRLDDAFRSYLAERGAKPVPLADVTSLVTGVAALRLTADAALDLWRRDQHQAEGDRAAARAELLQTSRRVNDWYHELAVSLAGGTGVPAPLAHDDGAEDRFVAAIRHVRMIWTGDHLDAARQLQAMLVGPARAITDQRTLAPFAGIHPWRPTRS